MLSKKEFSWAKEFGSKIRNLYRPENVSYDIVVQLSYSGSYVFNHPLSVYVEYYKQSLAGFH